MKTLVLNMAALAGVILGGLLIWYVVLPVPSAVFGAFGSIPAAVGEAVTAISGMLPA